MPPQVQEPPDPVAFARVLDPTAASPDVLPFLLALLVLVALFLRRTFDPVGFSAVDATLLATAPLLATREAAVFSPGSTATVVAMNFAGFLIPLLLSGKWLAKAALTQGPGILWRFGLGLAIVTTAAYFSSHAIPGEGVLLYYRIPALVAALAAVLLSWGAWHDVGPFAFSIGATGVILGADLFRLHELITDAHTPHHIVLGGAGILDGIFLVALLALTLSALAVSVAEAVVNRMHPAGV